MKTFSIVAALALAACAGPGELRMKAPAFEGASGKSSKTVAGCIVDRWEGGGHRPEMSTRPTANGYSVTAASDLGMYGKDTSIVIDVADQGSGSTTKFYSNIALSSGTALVAGIVRDCQQ